MLILNKKEPKTRGRPIGSPNKVPRVTPVKKVKKVTTKKVTTAKDKAAKVKKTAKSKTSLGAHNAVPSTLTSPDSLPGPQTEIPIDPVLLANPARTLSPPSGPFNPSDPYWAPLLQYGGMIPNAAPSNQVDQQDMPMDDGMYPPPPSDQGYQSDIPMYDGMFATAVDFHSTAANV